MGGTEMVVGEGMTWERRIIGQKVVSWWVVKVSRDGSFRTGHGRIDSVHRVGCVIC